MFSRGEWCAQSLFCLLYYLLGSPFSLAECLKLKINYNYRIKAEIDQYCFQVTIYLCAQSITGDRKF